MVATGTQTVTLPPLLEEIRTVKRFSDRCRDNKVFQAAKPDDMVKSKKNFPLKYKCVHSKVLRSLFYFSFFFSSSVLRSLKQGVGRTSQLARWQGRGRRE